MLQCVCAGWETDIKGKTEKHRCRFAYTNSGFCFRLMGWEIQACKYNSPLRSSIHSPKKKKKSLCVLSLPQIWSIPQMCAHSHRLLLALGTSNEWICCSHMVACCFNSTSLWWAWKWLLGKVILCTLAQLISQVFSVSFSLSPVPVINDARTALISNNGINTDKGSYSVCLSFSSAYFTSASDSAIRSGKIISLMSS